MPLETGGLVKVNGIRGDTGQYAFPELSTERFAQALRGQGIAEAPTFQVQRGLRLQTRAALAPGLSAENLAQVGWGVVFHRDEDSRVKAALQPLIDHRRRQAGSDDLVRALEYAPGDTIEAWLTNNRVWWGNVEPTLVPYYLLVVGAPDRIPFDFVHALDAEYLVGILSFDEVAGYDQYVGSVIAYETAATVANGRSTVFFGTQHPLDDPTSLSANWLVTPLADGTPALGGRPAKPAVGTAQNFRQVKLLAGAATRQALTDVWRSAAGPPPSVVFTATHGMVWPKGDAEQLPAQGALLCQDWSGFGSATAAHYFAARDVPSDARLRGVVAFLFACFGAGTPLRDKFSYEAGTEPPALAEKPFLAALPKRLLSHPAGGALACIGHVERAWGYSIVGQTSEPQLGVFRRAFDHLLLGHPVGMAVQEFNDRTALASVSLKNMLGQAYAGQAVDDTQLVTTWAECNDAEGYVLVGDPAVRLRVDKLVAP